MPNLPFPVANADVVNKILCVSLTTGDHLRLALPCTLLHSVWVPLKYIKCTAGTQQMRSALSLVLWGSLLFYVCLVVLEIVLFVASTVEEPIWMQTAAFSVIKRKKPLKLAFHFTAKNFETCFCCDIFPHCKNLKVIMLWFAFCMLYDFQGRTLPVFCLFLEHSVHLKYSLNNANNK